MTKRFKRGAVGPNQAESQFAEEMMGNGWGVTKQGWPDFICRRGDEIIFVEVKPRDGRKLPGPQRSVMSILESHGLKCFRWDPQCGFTDLDGNVTTIGFEHQKPMSKETLSDFMLRLRAQQENKRPPVVDGLSSLTINAPNTSAS